MSQGLAAQVADLAARVRSLEEERAVLSSLYRYAHAIDYGDEATWVDCFTPDGVFDLHYMGDSPQNPRKGFGTPHAHGRRFAGKEELAMFVANHTRAPIKWHKHVLVEPMITFDPDFQRARVRSYFVRIDNENGAREIWAFGRYIDDMVRGQDGRWRFKERKVETEARRPA